MGRMYALTAPLFYCGLPVNAGGNKAAPTTTTGVSAIKLDQETEDFHREYIFR